MIGVDEAVRKSIKGLPTDVSIFGFPSGLSWMMLGATCLFGAAAVAGPTMAVLHPSDRGSVAIAICSLVAFGGFSALTLRAFFRFRDSVAVNREGVLYLPKSGEPKFISWSDADVRADDTGQRLVITDQAKTEKIRLEYQLENFSKLREIVLEHTASQIHRNAIGIRVFHRTWINKIILATFSLVFLLLSVAFVGQAAGGPSFFLLALGAAPVLLIVRDPLRVVITESAVVIEYPGWNRKIPFDSISGIEIKDVSDRGNTWAAVSIARKNQRPTMLYRFREGSLALSEALQSAWREHADQK